MGGIDLLAKMHDQLAADGLGREDVAALAVGPDFGAVAGDPEAIGGVVFIRRAAVGRAAKLELQVRAVRIGQDEVPVGAGAVAATFIALASALGPKRPTAVKSEPFECGEVPFSVPAGRQSVKFYLTAILFVVFDVETVFMFPWAVIMDQLKLFGLIEMIVFLFILIIGYAYAWRQGALEWA